VQTINATQDDPSISAEFVTLLRTRVTEHNIRVIQSCYSRIRCSRVSSLLGLTEEQLEEHLSDMSSSGEVYVKIDRPQGTISFSEPVVVEEVLSDWAGNVTSLLTLMETTCHLINRENMVHKLH
jgi:26S proteasome regulatory subunit N5